MTIGTLSVFGLCLGVLAVVARTEAASALEGDFLRDQKNAVVFQQVLSSEGVFAIKERREDGVDGSASRRVVGVLIVEGRSLRYVVSWPVGVGRRVTCSAIVSDTEASRFVYSGIHDDRNEARMLAYNLERIGGLPMGQFENEGSDEGVWAEPLAALQWFTLESDLFTDYWQRVQ